MGSAASPWLRVARYVVSTLANDPKACRRLVTIAAAKAYMVHCMFVQGVKDSERARESLSQPWSKILIVL